MLDSAEQPNLTLLSLVVITDLIGLHSVLLPLQYMSVVGKAFVVIMWRQSAKSYLAAVLSLYGLFGVLYKSLVCYWWSPTTVQLICF